MERLEKDPFNIIITGVGGQGNVMASRILSNMLVRQGYQVTIGETFGASQRGGAVMSHIRVSARCHLESANTQGKSGYRRYPRTDRSHPGSDDIWESGGHGCDQYPSDLSGGGHLGST